MKKQKQAELERARQKKELLLKQQQERKLVEAAGDSPRRPRSSVENSSPRFESKERKPRSSEEQERKESESEWSDSDLSKSPARASSSDGLDNEDEEEMTDFVKAFQSMIELQEKRRQKEGKEFARMESKRSKSRIREAEQKEKENERERPKTERRKSRKAQSRIESKTHDGKKHATTDLTMPRSKTFPSLPAISFI